MHVQHRPMKTIQHTRALQTTRASSPHASPHGHPVVVAQSTQSTSHTSHHQVITWVQSQTNKFVQSGVAAMAAALVFAGGADARLEGVNKPELLPKEYTPIIDVAGFLTDGEERRLRTEVESLERDTGVKLRVLAQNYPDTPGLAIKDFWGVDADTIVVVADPSIGNIINVNVGENIDLLIPRNFWSRLAGKYGTKFYWQNNGQEEAIVNAIGAIDTCLREPASKFKCSKVQEPFDKY